MPNNYPGFALHDELKIYVDGGLTSLEALQTSVVNGPKFFGLLEKYGSVEVGKKADLLLLHSNPLLHIEATNDIFALIRAAFDQVRTRRPVVRFGDGKGIVGERCKALRLN